MPGTVAERPCVSLSFANNFWGKDDAGVGPLLDRMQAAKTTCEEMENFYTTRAAIEADYAKKLLALARKPLGSSEGGTLRMSLDVVRGEVESIGKAHQAVTQQMKTELDEQLTAFSGGMKERRKIVQSGVEKLLKVKVQQTQSVNKAKDRYEQDCLKIKGYLAQGHMVMGQEERKNKAKLEKTQIQLSSTSNEYEALVKTLEDTTVRWNREWKAACDKFQDLEEERIDFMKSSLWSFANIASTVCVSDDASCEKIRLSLEECDVEKDISNFIKTSGTGQEIPDAPKFIDFCREDANDIMSSLDDEDYSVAQFGRQTNPSFRTASPQPPMIEPSQSTRAPLETMPEPNFRPASSMSNVSRKPAPQTGEYRSPSRAQQIHQMAQREDLPEVPYNAYPTDGMTQFCRTGPPSDMSSAVSHNRPISRNGSVYSNSASYTSPEPSVGSISPVKQFSDMSISSRNDDGIPKKKSSVFQNRSPFVRSKSKGPAESPTRGMMNPPTSQRIDWNGSNVSAQSNSGSSPLRQAPSYSAVNSRANYRPSPSPEPVDPRASFQLNVGNNVFDVASPDVKQKPQQIRTGDNDADPIARALAELKGVTKQASVRQSADRYAGIGTPAPGQVSPTRNSNTGSFNASTRNSQAAPPSYENTPYNHLGAPQPAFTSRDMQRTTQQYVDQATNVFRSPSRQGSFDAQQQQSSPIRGMPPQGRPASQQQSRPTSSYAPRSASPNPMRSTSPRPGGGYDPSRQQQQHVPRAVSPSPNHTAAYADQRTRSQSASPTKNGVGRNNSYQSNNGYGGGQQQQIPRAVSPSPAHFNRGQGPQGGMALQLAPVQGQGNYAQQSPQRGRAGPQAGPDPRTRSRSAAGDGRQQVTKDGRPILHFARALYMYQAAIPEELTFAKGDMLAVLRHQDDGWWEAEVVGRAGRAGLVPSNYLSQ